MKAASISPRAVGTELSPTAQIHISDIPSTNNKPTLDPATACHSWASASWLHFLSHCLLEYLPTSTSTIYTLLAIVLTAYLFHYAPHDAAKSGPLRLPIRLVRSLITALAAAAHRLWISTTKSVSGVVKDLAFRFAKMGPVPQHVGFIMDGNRRFARRLGVKVGAGHMAGFKKLEEILEWCLRLGIQVVTVYAFSIENFKRPPEEVEALMDLAKSKFREFANNSEFIKKHGIRVQVIGALHLLPEDVREAAFNAMKMTKANDRAILNICFPYTSRDEIAQAVSAAVDGVRGSQHLKQLPSADAAEESSSSCIEGKADEGASAIECTEDLIDQHMFTKGCPPLDVLVRTSGEIRLSDFMLWQCAENCDIHFIDVLWPEFRFWDMFKILVVFQANYKEQRIGGRS
ncbi:cis-prenyltransferase [Quaeritorhiza haematococci]|nr:cis-prenyltransferase [Quaeritorhiza haematococci]